MIVVRGFFRRIFEDLQRRRAKKLRFFKYFFFQGLTDKNLKKKIVDVDFFYFLREYLIWEQQKWTRKKKHCKDNKRFFYFFLIRHLLIFSKYFLKIFCHSVDFLFLFFSRTFLRGIFLRPFKFFKNHSSWIFRNISVPNVLENPGLYFSKKKSNYLTFKVLGKYPHLPLLDQVYKS